MVVVGWWMVDGWSLSIEKGGGMQKVESRPVAETPEPVTPPEVPPKPPDDEGEKNDDEQQPQTPEEQPPQTAPG
jgi:hypothetical protein